MIINCYSIYDNQVDAFPDAPFFARSHGEAIRIISDITNNKEHPIGKHPEDYTLHFIASFNTENGTMTQAPGGAERVITCLDLIRKD